MSIRGKPFKKGVSGNPNGRPKVPNDIKVARALTKIEFELLVNQFLSMTREQLQNASKDANLSALDLMVLSIIQKAILGGDTVRLNFLLDRLIGKVTDKSEVTAQVTQLDMSDEELVRRAEEVLREIKASNK